jgi:hypothetical protein
MREKGLSDILGLKDVNVKVNVSLAVESLIMLGIVVFLAGALIVAINKVFK